jgi:hypothetical protein
VQTNARFFYLSSAITTPLPNLQATWTVNLQRIWNAISKPADVQETDYFDLSFAALPHKILS